MADKTILVIDDNPTVTKFVAGVLRPLGYRVETAADGVEGLQRLIRSPADLILVDFVMPRMNGYHFCKMMESKKLAPQATVVLLSASDARVVERMKQTTNVRDFLPKPVRAQDLRRLVARYAPLAPEAPEEEKSLDLAFEEGALETSDTGIQSPADRNAVLRDLLHHALGEVLAKRLDDILAAGDRARMLGMIGEVLDEAVSDELLTRLVDRVLSVADPLNP